MARICKSKMNYLWIFREKVYGYTRFPKVTVKNLNFFKTVVCRIIMLIYGPHNILTPLMILLCLKLKLSNVFPAFDNSSEDNVKIVECHHLFDYFAVTRVQIVEYRWFIRQISKIQELVPPIQLAVVPKSALTGRLAIKCCKKTRQNDFGGFSWVSVGCFSPPSRFWRGISCCPVTFFPAKPLLAGFSAPTRLRAPNAKNAPPLLC